MEKFLFKRIELWLVGLILVFCLLGAFAFGVVVRNAALGHDRYGALGRAALFLAELPSQARIFVKELPIMLGQYPAHILVDAQHDGKGVTHNHPQNSSEELVLLSGFFEDNNGARLLKRDGSIVAEWTFSAKSLVPNMTHCREKPATDWNALTHETIIWPDGSIGFNVEGCSLVRMSRCGKLLWESAPHIGHHSPTMAENGDILNTGHIYQSRENGGLAWPHREPYWDDTIERYTQDGELLYSKPLAEIFTKNGLGWLQTANGGFRTWLRTEYHANEVQELSTELAADFPMFEAGDLIISLRHQNMILVTDSEFENIKWWKVGPWIRQHDPDFQPGGKITVFDNHTDDSGGTVLGGSRIVEIDPMTNETRILYGGTEDQIFYTNERGNHQIQASGNILITEAQQGRVFEVNRDGEITWEYINRFDDERLAWMHGAAVYQKDYFSVSDWSCE